MAVLRMQRISICALKRDRKAILEKLQSLGVLEVSSVIGEDEDFRRTDTAQQKAEFEKAAVSAIRRLRFWKNIHRKISPCLPPWKGKN